MRKAGIKESFDAYKNQSGISWKDAPRIQGRSQRRVFLVKKSSFFEVQIFYKKEKASVHVFFYFWTKNSNIYDLRAFWHNLSIDYKRILKDSRKNVKYRKNLEIYKLCWLIPGKD